LLFDGKNIKKEKSKVKEKNRTLQVWTLQIEGDKGKRRGRLPKFGRTAPSASYRPHLLSNFLGSKLWAFKLNSNHI